MTPIPFAEANGTLLGGPAERFDATLPVEDLPVFRGGGEIISCWRPSFAERVRLILGARVWLRVLAPRTHAPVSIEVGP